MNKCMILCFYLLSVILSRVESDGFFKKVGSFFTRNSGGGGSGENSNEQIETGYQLGSLFIKPALNLLIGGSEQTTATPYQSHSNNQNPYPYQSQNVIQSTTPYNYANYAYSPGYYADSIVKCPNDILHGETITFTCKREHFTIPCTDYLFVHDTVHIECKSGYEYPKISSIKTKIECLPNGKWNAPIFECVHSCGRVTKKAAALIVHGSDTEVSEFPWNVAIYFSNVLVCGGSIINERIIISAAHCFTKETPDGIEKLPLEKYEIIAGKYFRDISAEEPFQTQIFKASRVKMHDTYYGYSGNYDADIAIITLDRNIIYQSHIGPICLGLDYKTIAEKQIPVHGTIGVVAGYGYTEFDGKPSNKLKKIELPIVDIKQCKKEAPENFKPFVTSDKFCAGYNDGTGAVCRGDSGAGYVVAKQIDDEKIYHLHGIVSNTRSVEGGCDLHFYAMFTHIQNYIDMIKEEIRLSKVNN